MHSDGGAGVNMASSTETMSNVKARISTRISNGEWGADFNVTPANAGCSITDNFRIAL
jgi:hypothetical protein